MHKISQETQEHLEFLSGNISTQIRVWCTKIWEEFQIVLKSHIGISTLNFLVKKGTQCLWIWRRKKVHNGDEIWLWKDAPNLWIWRWSTYQSNRLKCTMISQEFPIFGGLHEMQLKTCNYDCFEKISCTSKWSGFFTDYARGGICSSGVSKYDMDLSDQFPGGKQASLFYSPTALIFYHARRKKMKHD